MIKDLAVNRQNHQRASTPQLNRRSLMQAWEANKRHLNAISDPTALNSHGVRREVTFRLDVVLSMWANGYFDPSQKPHTGPVTRTIPLTTQAENHAPFWVVTTTDINALIFTQAARYVAPLDHLFHDASVTVDTCSEVTPVASNSVDYSVRRIFGFYTSQLFYRLLTLCLSSERPLQYDNWIWLPSWKVRHPRSSHRKAMLERQGLGLGKVIMTSGMLWIPQSHIDWRSGYLSLETLVELYIPRSPLQARVSSQANVQSLAASTVSIEYHLRLWLRESRAAFGRGQREEAEKLAHRAANLAAQEIARAYHQHILLKLQAYWSRVAVRPGGRMLQPLRRIQQGLDESAAYLGRIVNAQTIWEVYIEAWATFTQGDPIVDINQMPKGLPCWMTTRKYVPPSDGWSNFVFQHLFNRSSRPRWHELHFLQLYRSFKKTWAVIDEHDGSFDDIFRRIIGNYILVTFNNSLTKEVGTSHTPGSWYHGKPSFFQIQFWAPYFSPPTPDPRLGMQIIPGPTVTTAKDFHHRANACFQLWSRIAKYPQQLCESSRREKNDVCKRALQNLIALVGPHWSCETDDMPSIILWGLSSQHQCEGPHEDHLRLPIPASYVSGVHRDTKLCQPTILLPTRDNVFILAKAVETIPGLGVGVLKLVQWVRKALDNNGQQYVLLSHLEEKHKAIEPDVRCTSLLRRFLTQKNPPQRLIIDDYGGDGKSAEAELEEEPNSTGMSEVGSDS